MLGVAFLVTAIAIIAVWVLVELKRLRHKIFAMFLIMVILSLYFSVTYVFREKDINLNTIEGMTSASKLYYSWLVSVFDNVKVITLNAIRMDWSTQNSTR
jgi:hypothetical protein